MRKILSLKSCLIFTLLSVAGLSFGQTTPVNSVLAEGEWYKLRCGSTGVYKISYEFLSSIGFPVSGLKSADLKLYGNSTGLLPFANKVYRPDDLVENAVLMYDKGDGSFDAGDYFLFFGLGNVTWAYNNQAETFVHTTNFYDNFSYYFITRNDKNPKRASQAQKVQGTEDYLITEFPDHQVYEQDIENLIKSGRVLYGEKFDAKLSYSFNFNFQDIVSNSASIRLAMAMQSEESNTIQVSSGATNLGDATFGGSGGYIVANASIDQFTLQNPGSTIPITLTKAAGTTIAWLDYIEVVANCRLNFNGSHLSFRSLEGLNANKLLKFRITGMTADAVVVDITNPTEPKLVSGDLIGNTYEFLAYSDTLHQYAAIRGSNFSAPASLGKISNQNIHGLPQMDMVIMVNPDFYSEADRLAELHRKEGLSVVVLTPDLVYNEFSSGARDVTAIKDLMKMFYKRANGAPSTRPKYLLLFGDGSYINKDYAGNTNFLPTYQSLNSESLTDSYVTDDYFGFLDENEGDAYHNQVDIGIGRLPVSTPDQAREVVDKIYHYVSTGYDPKQQKGTFGNWRNKVLFIADDLSGNPGNDNEILHVQEADSLANQVDRKYKPFLTDKIYMDAYKQVSTPGGERYPDASVAFRNKVQQGALIVNYTGHGGEVGLAHERILDVQTIEGWTNLDALPLFVTATCEFSRFDDPGRTSAGELILLNSKGGGIGLFSTTRLVYSDPNFVLNNFFYDYALPDSTGKTMTLGEIIMHTKSDAAATTGHSPNNMNFMLLGDPALRLAYPKYRVHTTAINGVPVTQQADTLKAFSKITIAGEVTDLEDKLLGGFSGVVDITVYDKPENLRTLGNDNPLYKNFSLKDKVIYIGKATVDSGKFSCNFIVPKDISFGYGNGSIVYYANNGTTDANGGYEDVVVGGVSDEPFSDDNGPRVSLFMNTTDFDPGDVTDENPKLLAFLSDESGINTTGNGIGHEILATIDANTENAVVLNSYYTASLDTYKKGTVLYPYYKLPDGPHTITVKVWDINNNSATATTNFIVASANSLTINNLLNFPNPVGGDGTTFSFDHNQSGNDLSVKIEIYDGIGRVVKEINADVNEPGYQSKSIKWNGSSDGGYNIPAGIYVYRLTVKKQDGTETSKTNRLMLVK